MVEWKISSLRNRCQPSCCLQMDPSIKTGIEGVGQIVDGAILVLFAQFLIESGSWGRSHFVWSIIKDFSFLSPFFWDICIVWIPWLMQTLQFKYISFSFDFFHWKLKTFHFSMKNFEVQFMNSILCNFFLWWLVRGNLLMFFFFSSLHYVNQYFIHSYVALELHLSDDAWKVRKVRLSDFDAKCSAKATLFEYQPFIFSLNM